MADAPSRSLRPLLLKLAALAGVFAVVLVLLAQGWDLRGMVNDGLDYLRQAGPVVFFAGMAIAPAFGVPMLTFTLPAVALFGPRFGTPLVVIISLLAMTANYCLAYGLARRGLRPVLQALITRLGYKLPEVESGDAIDLVVILRVTPGVPFVVQNYLAGLAEVPFGKYFVVSAIIAWPLNTAFLLFGDALLHGKGKLALLSLSAVVALTAGLHLVRKHYERRRKKA